MQEKTYNIEEEEKLTEEQKKSGSWHSIPDRDLPFLEGANREQRRKWLRLHKRKLKKLGLGK